MKGGSGKGGPGKGGAVKGGARQAGAAGRLGLLPLAVLAAHPAAATSFSWNATVQGSLGYGTNPFLDGRSNAGTGLVGFGVAPVLTWRDPTATTQLSGSYNRTQYFSRYGHADDLDVGLRRSQQLSSKLSLNARVDYYSQISGLLSPYFNTFGSGPVAVADPGTIGTGAGATLPATGAVLPGAAATVPGAVVIDPVAADQLALGSRQRRVSGGVGADWQPTARDAFSFGVNADHTTYSRFGESNYSYLGANASYLRTLDARTKVGVSLGVGHIYSRGFPDTTSYQPNLNVQRTLSAHWTLNAGAGVIVEQERGRSSVTPGFNGSLCGTYPRLSVCFTADRVAAPSGIGGLRRQTEFGVSGSYQMTEHSRLVANAVHGTSDSSQVVPINGVNYGDQRYTLARLDYQRDLSRRLTAGVGGSYQARSGAGLPNVHALAATLNLSAKLGRLS